MLEIATTLHWNREGIERLAGVSEKAIAEGSRDGSEMKRWHGVKGRSDPDSRRVGQEESVRRS